MAFLKQGQAEWTDGNTTFVCFIVISGNNIVDLQVIKNIPEGFLILAEPVLIGHTVACMSVVLC